MENNKTNNTFKIDEKLAKAIVNKNLYFSDYKKESEFSKLPGHYQRAVNREAEFQVKTLSQTEGFAEILQDEKEAQQLHNAICEYYAHKGNLEEKMHPNHPQNLFSILMKRDSEAIARNPFEDKEQEDIYDKTSRRAKKFNQRIAERKEKGIEHNAKATIQNIYKHIKDNARN